MRNSPRDKARAEPSPRDLEGILLASRGILSRTSPWAWTSVEMKSASLFRHHHLRAAETSRAKAHQALPGLLGRPSGVGGPLARRARPRGGPVGPRPKPAVASRASRWSVWSDGDASPGLPQIVRERCSSLSDSPAAGAHANGLPGGSQRHVGPDHDRLSRRCSLLRRFLRCQVGPVVCGWSVFVSMECHLSGLRSALCVGSLLCERSSGRRWKLGRLRCPPSDVRRALAGGGRTNLVSLVRRYLGGRLCQHGADA
jgi:hypothetical protein